MLQRWLPLAVLAFVFAVYAATLQTVEYSDGVHIAAMVGGPTPERYYNWLYVFVGWCLHHSLGAALGWSTWHSLGLLSALCGAATAGFVTWILQRRGLAPSRAALWALFLAATPGAWFFCTTVEVHSIQLLGCGVATWMCLTARDALRGRALLIVAAAAVLALLAHLTSVLLLPILFTLALPPRGTPHELGVPRRPVPLALAALAAALLLFGALKLGHADVMLWQFKDLFLARFSKHLLYSFPEVLTYLWDEVAQPMALLLVALALGLWMRRGQEAERVRHLLLGLLVAALPFLVVLTQGGIRERGAYYLGLYTVLVLLGAEAAQLLERRLGQRRWLVPAALVLLTLVQATLSLRAITTYDRGPTAVEWAREARDLTEPPAYAFLSSLPRYHAVARVEGLKGIDLHRDLELVPDRELEEQTKRKLELALHEHQAGTHVYFDADLFRADSSGHMLELNRFLVQILEDGPVELIPVPADTDEPLLFHLVFRKPPQR